MKYTYQAYKELILLLMKYEYYFCSYNNSEQYNKSVIMRHDLDLSIQYAMKFAEIEYKMGIKSTYFVLVSSDFYNIFSRTDSEYLKTLMNMGHNIGLHFDRKKYGEDFDCTHPEYINKLMAEINILETALGKKIDCLSFHEPLLIDLGSELQIQGIENAYSKKFFSNFKYFSDSSMVWREEVLKGIESEQFNKLQILTHPFWYSKNNGNISDRLVRFINDGGRERYEKIAKWYTFFK